jgi:hypothetical protein
LDNDQKKIQPRIKFVVPAQEETHQEAKKHHHHHHHFTTTTTMTHAHPKNQIEAVVFLPDMMSFYSMGQTTRERTLSYEDMNDLTRKLNDLMYHQHHHAPNIIIGNNNNNEDSSILLSQQHPQEHDEKPKEQLPLLDCDEDDVSNSLSFLFLYDEEPTAILPIPIPSAEQEVEAMESRGRRRPPRLRHRRWGSGVRLSAMFRSRRSLSPQRYTE